MHFSFRTDHPGLERTAFLIERPGLDACGDCESAFLSIAHAIERHPRADFGTIAARLAADPETEAVAAIRNPALVLDDGLAGRIAAGLAGLAPLAGRWSVAAAGGLTPSGERVSALYSASQPFLPCHGAPRPLTDAMPDLFLADAGWLRQLCTSGGFLPDTGFESAVIALGYLGGRVALYAPALVAGINGPLRARDAAKIGPELQDRLGDTLPGQEVPTLTGPVALAAAPRVTGRPRCGVPGTELAEEVARTVAGHCDPLSLSIVTRTRFARPHLLGRLLASITRARRDGMAIEVVLSTDLPPAAAEAATAELRAGFVNLTLRLVTNAAAGHSRVTNLIGGLRAATGEYVAVMDDDDHVDLFAFDRMQQTLFLGARPLMVTTSAVHAEHWEETASGAHVLTATEERLRYPASGWRDLFAGVNRLPVCALVMPRGRLHARLDAFEFRHDLSEDYALALLMLTDPELPEVIELPGVFGHISLREGDGQSVSLRDRRGWARDIALYLADLAREKAVAGPGRWIQLAGHPGAAAAADATTAGALRAALAKVERDLRLARREADRLRAELAAAARHATWPAVQPAAAAASAPPAVPAPLPLAAAS